MSQWLDDESLLEEYVKQLGYKGTAGYCSWLRRFQRFIRQHSPQRGLNERVFRAWVHKAAEKSPRSFVIRQAEFVKGFLDWLVQRNVLRSHPLQDLQRRYQCRSIRAITGALMSSNPDHALEALRPLPRYGSHLGSIMREHIQRMRNLGCRYGHENAFLHFDRFLQQRRGAEREAFGILVREYIAGAGSVNSKLRRLVLGRLIAKALNRRGTAVAIPSINRLWLRQNRNQQLQPYIYTTQEVERLLATAREFPSPRSPLRPITLSTMLVLAYCAGLRLGEIVRLKLKDVDLTEASIEICDSKFFKSRRLPLSKTAIAALTDYLRVRRKAGAPMNPESPVFWHRRRGYRYSTAGHLLYRVIRDTGIRTKTGKPPRIHDLRHTFTVHRLTSWYQDGIQPDSRLPYLSAYLGHRNLHSTLVYLTMTDELLERANQRFRSVEAEVLQVLRGEK